MLSKMSLGDLDVEGLVRIYDQNKDGELQYHEFVAFLLKTKVWYKRVDRLWIEMIHTGMAFIFIVLQWFILIGTHIYFDVHGNYLTHLVLQPLK